MFKVHKIHSIIGITVLLFISVTTAGADILKHKPIMSVDGKLVSPNSGLPKYYPTSFQGTGVIYKINSSSMTVTGSAEKYTISPNVLIHSLSTEFSTRQELRKGRTIGFSFTTNGSNQRVMTEIWILPAWARPKL